MGPVHVDPATPAVLHVVLIAEAALRAFGHASLPPSVSGCRCSPCPLELMTGSGRKPPDLSCLPCGRADARPPLATSIPTRASVGVWHSMFVYDAFASGQ